MSVRVEITISCDGELCKPDPAHPDRVRATVISSCLNIHEARSLAREAKGWHGNRLADLCPECGPRGDGSP